MSGRLISRGFSVVAILLALAPFAAHGASVDLPFRVEIGQRSNVTIVKERETYSAGALRSQGRTSTPVAVQVVDRAGGGWVYRWTFGEPVIEDPERAANPLARRMAKLLAGLELEFETTRAGLPTRMRNPAAVRRHLGEYAANLVSGVMAQARAAGASEAELDELKQRLDRMTSVYMRMSDEQIGRTFMAEATVLHRVTGEVHSTEAPETTPDEVQSPLGGPPIRAVTTTRLREVDAEDGSAVVEWRREYDPETALGNLSTLVPDLPRTAFDGDLPPVELTESALYTIDTGTGQVRSLTYEKLVGIGEQKLIERRIVTQVPAR